MLLFVGGPSGPIDVRWGIGLKPLLRIGMMLLFVGEPSGPMDARCWHRG
jgi:hypothetical protein